MIVRVESVCDSVSQASDGALQNDRSLALDSVQLDPYSSEFFATDRNGLADICATAVDDYPSPGVSMSSPPTTHDSRTSPSSESTEKQDDDGVIERLFPTLADPIRKIGFWTAIVLPFLYVPLLVTGLSTATETGTFLILLAVNLLALYVGHAHRQ